MTPSDPEFWPPSMTRSGATATREQMVQAWRWWWSRDIPVQGWQLELVAFDLGRAIYAAGVNACCADLANAMLQRARKAGHIHYDGREWREGPGK